MRLTFPVEGNPALVNAIVQRHRALQEFFDHQWAHLVVLDFRSGEFFQYEPMGRWQSVPLLSLRMLHDGLFKPTAESGAGGDDR